MNSSKTADTQSSSKSGFEEPKKMPSKMQKPFINGFEIIVDENFSDPDITEGVSAKTGNPYKIINQQVLIKREGKKRQDFAVISPRDQPLAPGSYNVTLDAIIVEQETDAYKNLRSEIKLNLVVVGTDRQEQTVFSK